MDTVRTTAACLDKEASNIFSSWYGNAYSPWQVPQSQVSKLPLAVCLQEKLTRGQLVLLTLVVPTEIGNN